MAKTQLKQRYSSVLVLGSVGFDVIMNLPGRFGDFIMPDKIHKLNVSFTVDTLLREFGGTGGNCAYSMGLLKMKPKLVSVMGIDGDEYIDFLESSGVDLEHLRISEKNVCAVGHVMTDLDDNQIWSYYPGSMVEMVDIVLSKLVDGGVLVALLPDNPKAYPKHVRECAQMGVDFLYDPAFFIPNLSKNELKMGIDTAKLIIGNDYEIELMEKKTDTKVNNWVDRNKVVIRTMGPKGSEIMTKKGRIRVGVAKPKSVADPTGAGDAYRAGFLTGYAKGMGLKTCGQLGAVVSAYTVEKYGTQTHSFSLADIKRRYKKIFGETLVW